MYIETWHKVTCEECNTKNWLYDGNVSDLSGVDIDGFRCRKCGNVEVFDEELVKTIHGDTPIEEIIEKYSVNIVDGLEKPE